MDTAFRHALHSYRKGGNRALLDTLAKYKNPLFYAGKNEIPKHHKLVSKFYKPKHPFDFITPMAKSMPQGIVRSMGTTAAKIQDLTKGITKSQNIFQKTWKGLKNVGNVMAKDLRGNYMYREIPGVGDSLKSGRMYIKQNGKILSNKKAFNLYKKNPDAAIKDMHYRGAWRTKGEFMSRKVEGHSGVGAVVRKRRPAGAAMASFSAPGLAATTYFTSKKDLEGNPNSQLKRIGMSAGELALWGLNPAIGTAAMIGHAGLNLLKKPKKPKQPENIQQLL